MGNLVATMMKSNASMQWPSYYEELETHWCLSSAKSPFDVEKGEEFNEVNTCQDSQFSKEDPKFDYSVFRCRGASCQLCLDLNAEVFPDRKLNVGTAHNEKDPASKEIHFTWKALVASAETGTCQVCSALVEGIRGIAESTEDLEDTDVKDIDVENTKDGTVEDDGPEGDGPEDDVLDDDEVFCLEIRNGHTVCVTQEKIGKEKVGLCVEFYSHADNPTPWVAVGASATVKSDISVVDCVSFINSHIIKCVGHPTCSTNRASIIPKLPTRLIDVGTGEDDIRLEESPKAGEKYITLSHCWGTQPIPRTLMSNLQQQRKNIPWSSLSKNFQDAIIITRGLGLRYVWIDSLCIIQDNTSDWEIEASDMADIYTKSYLTLAATSSSDSAGGLLKPRYNADKGKAIRYHNDIEIKRRHSKTGGLPGSIRELEKWTEALILKGREYAKNATRYGHRKNHQDSIVLFARSVITKSHTLLSNNPTHTKTALAPLLQRAWVLQERLLSPRTVHFCADELVWECKSFADCECGYAASESGKLENESPSGERRFMKLFNRDITAIQTGNEANSRHEEELLWAWYRLVESYTVLDITFSSDRLPALRGLAAYMEGNFGWQYVHGLWINDIVRGLLWSRIYSPTKRTAHAVPSWSWAAIESVGSAEPSDRMTLSLSKQEKPIQLISGLVEHHDDDSSWEIFDDKFCVLGISAGLHENDDNRIDPELKHAYEGIIPANTPFIVLKAAMVDMIVGLETNPSVTTTELRLFTLVGNKQTAVTWDIESEDKKSEVEIGDKISCIVVSKNLPKCDGLALRKNENGSYSRLGYFKTEEEDAKFFHTVSARQIVVV